MAENILFNMVECYQKDFKKIMNYFHNQKF